MEYPQLVSLVPAGEHFDSSAINEGIYLTIAHVNSIEERLAIIDQANSALDAGLQTMEQLNQNIDSLTQQRDDAVQSITVNEARIKELQDEVAALGGQSSGKGTVLSTTKDETAGDNEKVPSWLDDSNPANQFADKQIRTKK